VRAFLRTSAAAKTETRTGCGLSLPQDQTVTFTLAGTIWELDDNAISSLHCRSRTESPANEGERLPGRQTTPAHAD